MAGINSGILNDAYPLSSDEIKRIEDTVLNTQETFVYLDEEGKLNFALGFSPALIKDLAWHNANELFEENGLFIKKVYEKTGLDTFTLSEILQKTDIDGSWSGSGSTDAPAPGLYQTGAIALYEEQGAEAAEGMMIKSWDELVAEGVVHVEDGVVYSNFNLDSWENASSDALAGDLVLPSDGSIASIGNAHLDENWDYIGNVAFERCYNLTGIIIPDSVTSITLEAFCNCNSLTSVVIGNGVTSIGIGAFRNCEVLSSVIIPGSVKTFGYEAFGYCVGLANATIAEGVECIGEYAFAYSFKVGFTPGSSALYLPSTITEIQSRAFAQTALTDVYYNGTCDQFRAINKASDFFYYNSIVVIHCTDGDYDWT